MINYILNDTSNMRVSISMSSDNFGRSIDSNGVLNRSSFEEQLHKINECDDIKISNQNNKY